MSGELQSLAEARERSGLLANWLNAQIDGRETSSGIRHRVSGACYSIALDHHVAIVTLLERQLYASAFALVRPVFEAYIRGNWLLHVADECWLAKPTRDRRWPKTGPMIASLETTDVFAGGPLSGFFASQGSLLHDLTHTGFQQIHRWNTADAIQQDYSRSDIDGILSFADAIALLAASGLAVLIDDADLGNRLLERIKTQALDAQ